MFSIVAGICIWGTSNRGVAQQLAGSASTEVEGKSGTVVFAQRKIPEGVPKKGHGKDAKKYGYRIPSLLTTSKGTLLAFSERRLGLHDHAQNDIVVKRSSDGGKSWGKEIVVHEDGMNSINDPLSVQLSDGRILIIFARFPYGRHARNAGWIKMAEPGYDDRAVNVLTFITSSSDDGKTWSKPRDISRSVKPKHWLNANCPGAMIQLTKGPNRGRIVVPLWGTVPIKDKPGARTWQIVVARSDDSGKNWSRTEPLKDPEKGFPNECQIAQASDGSLVLVSRNQGGATFRKKAFSKDGGETWTKLATDPTLPSVACMGSLIRGPKKSDDSWDLYATFPSSQGRKNGQIAVSTDHGKSFRVVKRITGPFAYSTSQISPDGKKLFCLYEAENYKSIRILGFALDQFKSIDKPRGQSDPAVENQ